jgi:hypothetical protein
MGLAPEKRHLAASETPQVARDPLRGAPAIGVVEGERGDRRDAEKLGEFSEPSVLIHGGTI